MCVCVCVCLCVLPHGSSSQVVSWFDGGSLLCQTFGFERSDLLSRNGVAERVDLICDGSTSSLRLQFLGYPLLGTHNSTQSIFGR